MKIWDSYFVFTSILVVSNFPLFKKKCIYDLILLMFKWFSNMQRSIMFCNFQCPSEWFHYPCVGITAPPKGKWYCPQCTASMKRRGGRKN